MAKYRKKPVVIDAVQFTGGNITEIDDFITVKFHVIRNLEQCALIIPTL